MEVRQQDSHMRICEFGENILYMPPPVIKQDPKLENRFYPGICLGKDTSSGESYKNHQNTSQTMEVQSTHDGRHQWCAMSTKSITLQSTLRSAKHDISTKADRRQRHHNTGRRDTSNRESTTHERRSNIIKETEGYHHRGDTSASNNSTNIICTIYDSSRSTGWKSNIKKDTGRQHHRRKHSKTTKDNNRTTGSTKA